MSRSLVAPIAFACTLLCAAQAHADTLTFAGFADGSETVDVVFGAFALSTPAGGLATSLNGGPSFVTYCIELSQYVSFGAPITGYTLGPVASHTFTNANAGADIGKLYAENNLVTGSVAQAAFQIAVWELAYETAGNYDLASGSAQFSGGTAATSGALALASTWLGTLATTTNTTYTVSTFDSAANQDQVFAAPVPEPSTYALMAGGLLAMGFVARRRAKRQG